MKAATQLARAFTTLAAQGQQIDSTASAVLSIVQGAGAVNEKLFDELVTQAYEKNGWNTEVGRPPLNRKEPKGAAPNTVRTYVTIMRRAIRVGLRIGHYDTFTSLRTALERKLQPRLVRQGKANGRKAGKNGAQLARIPRDLASNFIGVDIESPREPNGALFHDLAATFVGLKREEDRAEMGREIAALLHKWLPRAGVASVVARRSKRPVVAVLPAKAA